MMAFALEECPAQLFSLAYAPFLDEAGDALELGGKRRKIGELGVGKVCLRVTPGSPVQLRQHTPTRRQRAIVDHGRLIGRERLFAETEIAQTMATLLPCPAIVGGLRDQPGERYQGGGSILAEPLGDSQRVKRIAMLSFPIEDIATGGRRVAKAAMLQQLTRATKPIFGAFDFSCRLHWHFSPGPPTTSTYWSRPGAARNANRTQRAPRHCRGARWPSCRFFRSDLVGKAQTHR